MSPDLSPSLIAVETYRRSPQTIGLEWPRPGMSVFQRTFFDVATSHSTGSGKPSATPTASWPRNAGQLVSLAAFCPEAEATRRTDSSRADTAPNRR